jgi:hypothetical protein
MAEAVETTHVAREGGVLGLVPEGLIALQRQEPPRHEAMAPKQGARPPGPGPSGKPGAGLPPAAPKPGAWWQLASIARRAGAGEEGSESHGGIEWRNRGGVREGPLWQVGDGGCGKGSAADGMGGRLGQSSGLSDPYRWRGFIDRTG